MAKNHKNVYEIIGDDPFNIKILNETLLDIKETIFENLYSAQKVLTNILRFDFDMANHSVLSNTECIYSLNTQFITNKNRNAFKLSKLYKKDLDPDTISSNPQIFSNNILVFINGELHINYYVRPNEDITDIVFKLYSAFPNTDGYIRTGFTKGEMQELINSHAKMTILIVKSHNTFIFNTNRARLINHISIEKYLGLPMVNFDALNNRPETDVFTSWVTHDDKKLYKFKILTTEKGSNNKLYFNDDEIYALTNTHTHLRNIYLPDHFMTVNILKGTEYFELPIKDMPIPIENILVFKKTNDGIYFDHDTAFTLHYPNIYKINNGASDDLILYIYYADDTKSIGSKYKNELSLYYRFTNNILEKYRDGSIPDIIKNYSPITMEYDHNNLILSTKDHLSYKLDKLDEMIYQNGDYYSIYLNKLVAYTPVFDVDLSEIDNWRERLRVDNSQEILDKDRFVYFDEPCYMFTFNHKGNEILNIIVDNKQIDNLYSFNDETTRYVYIPIRLINNNSSRMTVERCYDYIYTEDISIDLLSKYYKINLPKNVKFGASDIYFSIEIDGIKKYVDEDSYSMYTIKNGVYTEITSDDFYKYDSLFIKVTDENYIGQTITANINRVLFYKTVKGKNNITISRDINNDKKNILMFYNGRLVPYRLRKYEFSENITGPHKISALIQEEPGDIYTLVYTPNKYYPVYYQDKIRESGLVDLSGKISKPIDLKWYDIYLNGLRIQEDNIEILGPFTFLIKDIPTLTNLEIYQKNLDCSSIKEIETSDITSEIYKELVEEFEKNLPKIEDTIPDIFENQIIDIFDFLDKYLLDLRLINPDLEQITEEMINLYPSVMNIYNTVFMNPDLQIPIEHDVFLNPDTNTVTV